VRTDPGPTDPAASLTAALVRACRALAAAGRTEDAACIAADAWLSLRATRPTLAHRLDGAMHYIARLEQQGEPNANLADSAFHLDKAVTEPAEEATT
jgi:hypothetical protein